jgi:predicted phosphodiesterase
MTTITFIGDVHGHTDTYLKLIEDVEYSVQLGDMGFDYSKLYDVDTKRHRFVPGNHENYPVLNVWMQEPCSFPVHGLFEMGDVSIFAFRGAFTVDKYRRVEGVDWFPDEELSQKELHKTITNIVNIKPRIIVSHDCPSVICKKLLKEGIGDIAKYAPTHIPSRSQQAMQSAFDLLPAKPEYWIFGHHHTWFNDTVEGTRFVCVPELSIYKVALTTL